LEGLGVGLLLRLLGEREEPDEDDERARGPRFAGLGDLDTDLDTDRRVGLLRGGGVGDLVTGDFLGDLGGGDAFGDLGLGGGGGALSLISFGSLMTSFTSLVSFSFTSFLALGVLLFSSPLLLLLDPLLLDPLLLLLLLPELLLRLLLDPELELRLLLELPELDVELLRLLERLRLRLPLSAPFFTTVLLLSVLVLDFSLLDFTGLRPRVLEVRFFSLPFRAAGDLERERERLLRPLKERKIEQNQDKGILIRKQNE